MSIYTDCTDCPCACDMNYDIKCGLGASLNSGYCLINDTIQQCWVSSECPLQEVVLRDGKKYQPSYTDKLPMTYKEASQERRKMGLY